MKRSLARRDQPLQRISKHFRTPLYRNGYALILNGAATSALGFLYWTLAARYYTAKSVGINSTMISAMVLLSGLVQLGLGPALVRFVPTAGRRSTQLVVSSYVIALVTSLTLGSALTLLIGVWVNPLRFLASDRPAFILFVLSVAAWTIFSLQDSVLTGMRQSIWVPLENAIFAVVKIVILVALASNYARYGIFTSWIVPVVVSLPLVNILIFYVLLPRHIALSQHVNIQDMFRTVSKFVGGNYPGNIFIFASTTVLPIIVTAQAGSTASAHFYVPWIMATVLQLIAYNLSTSLIVEAVRDRENMASYFYKTFLEIARLLVPLLIVYLLGAMYMLELFGQSYAATGSTLLRVLALAAIPNALVSLYLSLARVENRYWGTVFVQGCQAVLIVVLSFVMLRFWGIVGVGIAFLISQTVTAMVVGLRDLWPILLAGRAIKDNEVTEFKGSSTAR